MAITGPRTLLILRTLELLSRSRQATLNLLEVKIFILLIVLEILVYQVTGLLVESYNYSRESK